MANNHVSDAQRAALAAAYLMTWAEDVGLHPVNGPAVMQQITIAFRSPETLRATISPRLRARFDHWAAYFGGGVMQLDLFD